MALAKPLKVDKNLKIDRMFPAYLDIFSTKFLLFLGGYG